ncbi:MAG: Sugar-binding transcriptional regulator [Eubacteriales bacterium]|jgi:deoxyribonucleoside regulator
MRKIVGDEHLLIKCCTMYYEQYLTQEQISKILGISRPTVSRLLKESREKKIIKVEIQNSYKRQYEIEQLEQELEQKFGLMEVIITNDGSDENDLKAGLGKATAKYLERILKDSDVVGVSMGSTLKEIAPYVSSGMKIDATFVPLIGGVGQIGIEIHPNQIVLDLARAFSGRYKLLHAPAVISDLTIKKNMEMEKSLSEVMEYVHRTTVAVVGIGAPTEKSTMLATGYFDEEKGKKIRDLHLVGDICLQLYDINGNYSLFSENKKVFGMELEDLKKIRRVVGVAGGTHKVDAIIGAIQGKYINVLVTNYSNAKKINEFV